MRKDVKLGFAIGGVLLSVLIVYVLVISGGDKPQQVTMVTTEPAAVAPVPAVDLPKPPAVTPEKKDEKKDIIPEPIPVAIAKPPSTAPSGVDSWAEGVLSTGKLPVMLTTTPLIADMTSPLPIVAEANRSTPGGGEASSSGASSNTPAVVPPIAAMGGSPATRPASLRPTPANAGRTHTVQPNETFASIAAAAYGNSAYFPHIIRANPTVDPRKLRPGMVINLPPINDVRVETTTVASASFDAKTQYQVQPNDNLYKISIKLYGKADQGDKIYDLNKSTIGPDKQKVKPGMVLTLPQPPSQKLQ